VSVSVLVVDDQPLVRHAVRDILADGGLVVVGEAATGAQAVELARALEPDVVLMDIRMPVLDGIAATARITADADAAGQVPPRVLILTTFEDDENVVAALRAGASGFLGKGADPDEIVRGVLTVHRGDALLSAAATRTVIERSLRGVDAQTDESAVAALTAREREVLVLVATGSTNHDIAHRLTISPHTAKTHVNRIMTKTGSRDRAQLVILAYESGLVVAGT
jgi:DNA-binding NarL/FixJ family response regulator